MRPVTLLTIALSSTLWSLLGCSESRSIRAWTANQGGVLLDARQARVERVARTVLPPGTPGAVTVRILDSADPTAFSWPNGQVFVTRGLVDLLDDQELAAAIAHELGHLVGDGLLKHAPVAALRGCCKDFDAEARADAIGVNLLRDRNLPAHSMAGMLERVRASGSLPPSCREAIGHRIELIHDIEQPVGSIAP